MDTEQAFFRVHARLSGLLSRLLTPRFRQGLEYLCLLNAFILLAILLTMHINFVGQPACAEELASIQVKEAQLLRIQVTGIWSNIADELFKELRLQLAAVRNRQFKWKGLLDRWKHNLWTGPFEGADRCSKVPDPGVHFSGGSLPGLAVEQTTASSGSEKSRVVHCQERSVAEAVPGSGHDRIEADSPESPGTTGSLLMTGRPDLEEPLGEATQEGQEAGNGGGVASSPSFGLGRGPLATAVLHYFKWWWNSVAIRWETVAALSRAIWQELVLKEDEHFLDTVVPSRTERHSDIVEDLRGRLRGDLENPLYIYSQEKGYLLLSESAKTRHLINTVNISLPANRSCFGGRWQRLLIDNIVGYDTILTNSLLSAQGRGYLYNLQTKELYNLNYAQEITGASDRLQDYLIFKFGVLITSLFVFFTTTMSVSFTLRETQSRMLKFTVQLQHHARHRLPTFRLIFVHVVESLVFVPIMIGILFFLFEFFDDQLLAFLVLSLVWVCEVFTLISVRTAVSMQYFPRFFFLYFMVFHIYFFSFTYGFSYLAFFTMAAFMQHAVLFFWNRHEVPALQSIRRRRAQLNPPPHIATTSTLGILSALSLHSSFSGPPPPDGRSPAGAAPGAAPTAPPQAAGLVFAQPSFGTAFVISSQAETYELRPVERSPPGHASTSQIVPTPSTQTASQGSDSLQAGSSGSGTVGRGEQSGSQEGRTREAGDGRTEGDAAGRGPGQRRPEEAQSEASGGRAGAGSGAGVWSQRVGTSLGNGLGDFFRGRMV